MELKGQAFLISSIVIIIVLTIIELYFKLFYQNNKYNYNFEIQYFENIKKEIFLSSVLTNESSLENFIDFLSFEKNYLETKNYNSSFFAVHVSNYNHIKNKINITLINFMDKNIIVNFVLNSTPQQSDNVLLLKNEYYSKIFDIDPNQDYKLTIDYEDQFNMTIELTNESGIFIFLDMNIFSEKIKYIDKSEKSYYFI